MHTSILENSTNGVATAPALIERQHNAGMRQTVSRSRDSIEWTKFGVLLVELIGLACLVGRYRIESAAFFQLFLLALIGFGIHYVLPLAYRLSFFVLLSLASIVLVLGVAQGAWLVTIGLALILLCHLPIPFSARLASILIAALALAAYRANWAAAPWSSAIWPILGAMFMFRLMVYLYDLKHGQAPTSWSARLAYFFMLPNVCFPLLPIVDSRTLLRTYYDGDRHEIHQRGVEWIARGLIQLLLYRIVYQKLAIDPYDVANVADLAHYFLWLFLLYLRVSGQFHVIVGMLHLFGFHLPETHRLYYFASSFTDFWRRINIYWKDFMMKVFYYPVYFRARRFGPTWGLIISTAIVFGLTWALHAYQLFWIRGAYVFTWNDLLFWTILCGLVVVNSLWESRFGRQRILGNTSRTWKDSASLVLKTCATFFVICILWSFWSSESLSFWFSLWPAALVPPTWTQVQTVAILVLLGLVALGTFLAWRAWLLPYVNRRFELRTLVVLLQLFALNLITISAIHGRLGVASGYIAAARTSGLNVAEMDMLERGYYEDLLTVDRFNGELAALYAKRPAAWAASLQDVGMTEPAKNVRYALRPHAEAVFKGAMLRTNAWGMHDREYSLERPADCLRIALLGASHTMGTGLDRQQTFDFILEARLNQEFVHPDFRRYEILNFAVYGYQSIEQLQVLEARVPAFQPQIMLYFGHPGDVDRVVNYLTNAVKAELDLHPFLQRIISDAGVGRDTPVRLVKRRLKPFGSEVLSWVYHEMAARCSRHGIRPVFVLLPLIPEFAANTSPAREIELAKAAGFTVLDLQDVYSGRDRDSLWIAEWDAHPNALGHMIIANRLYQLIQEQRAAILPELKP
jgi:hypothetical protein